MEQFSVKVEKTGRILIPVSIRRKLLLVEGSSELVVRVDDSGLMVGTRRQALDRVRTRLRHYIQEGSDVSGELIEDRRQDAAREDAS
jgi:bifunctional DNA-binding transcriptional regulator/antitoxin component of YhaV-PrlF toxin-antitoxin module